jgi:hypothetical protein
MKKFIVVVLAVMLVLGITATSTATTRGGDGRKFKITYNAALSLHEAAVPTKFAKTGQKMKIFYKGKTLVVHAVAGGCKCFDISDEGMNKLASTSKGVITAKVKKV